MTSERFSTSVACVTSSDDRPESLRALCDGAPLVLSERPTHRTNLLDQRGGFGFGL